MGLCTHDVHFVTTEYMMEIIKQSEHFWPHLRDLFYEASLPSKFRCSDVGFSIMLSNLGQTVNVELCILIDILLLQNIMQAHPTPVFENRIIIQ